MFFCIRPKQNNDETFLFILGTHLYSEANSPYFTTKTNKHLSDEKDITNGWIT